MSAAELRFPNAPVGQAHVLLLLLLTLMMTMLTLLALTSSLFVLSAKCCQQRSISLGIDSEEGEKTLPLHFGIYQR